MSKQIPAIVINLKRSEGRRVFMQQQLNQLHIPHEFLDATDGKTLSDTEIEALYDRTGSLAYIHTPLTRNEIACADSHLRVYKKIIEENIPFALILEDDAKLNPQIVSILNEDFLSQKKFDWLQIDYSPVGLPFLKQWWRGVWIYTKQNPLFLFGALLKFPYIAICSLYEAWRERRHRHNPAIVYFARPLYLASAYVISRGGAEKLLALGTPIRFAADMLPNKARILKRDFVMRAVAPKLAGQSDQFESEIGLR